MEVRISKITREDMVAHLDKIAEEVDKRCPIDVTKDTMTGVLDLMMRDLDHHGFAEQIDEMGECLTKDAKWHVSEETDTEYVLTIDSYEGDAQEACEWVRQAMTQMIEFEAYEGMIGLYAMHIDW